MLAKLVALFVPGAGLVEEGLEIVDEAYAPSAELVAAAKSAFALLHSDPVAGVAAAQNVVSQASQTMTYNPASYQWHHVDGR